MFPQIKQRRIGKIKIIDIQGDLVGPWAMKAKDELHHLVENGSDMPVVINLKQLHGIDSLGVKAITENLPVIRRAALLNGNLSVMDMLQTTALPKDVRMFRTEEELVRHYGKELVSNEAQKDDKRKHDRLMSALPVEFNCKDAQGKKMQFHAIITNLSEGGIFAEYINLEDAVKSQDFVNPYELKMLEMKIELPDGKNLKVKGKVVRRKLDGEQVGIGIEFYQISDSDKYRIKQFLGSSTALV